MNEKLTFSMVAEREKSIEALYQTACLWTRIIFHCYQLSTTCRVLKQLKGNEGLE